MSFSQRSNRGMVLRYLLFISLSFLILTINAIIYAPRPPKPQSGPVAIRQAAPGTDESPKPPEVGEQGTSDQGAKATAVSQAAKSATVSRSSQPGSEGPLPADSTPQAGDTPETSASAGDTQPRVPEEGEPPKKTTLEELARADTPEGVPEPPLRYVTLGSLDSAGPYRMLVTLTNRGAAVVRIELNQPRFCDAENRSGYLGFITTDQDPQEPGCVVEVVGPGTPAAQAGLKPGDIVLAINNRPIDTAQALHDYLLRTKPRQVVQIEYLRDGERQTTLARLIRKPVEVIRPEGKDPLSFLLTLSTLDDLGLQDIRRRITLLREQSSALWRRLSGSAAQEAFEEAQQKIAEIHSVLSILGKKPPGLEPSEIPLEAEALSAELRRLQAQLDRIDLLRLELPAAQLREKNWEIVSASEKEVTFRLAIDRLGLVVEKQFVLAEVPPREVGSKSERAYHLTLRIQIRNEGNKPLEVGYQLDGPTGLPTEGRWYTTKVGPGWGAYGMRDVAVAWNRPVPDIISCWRIADDRLPLWEEGANERLIFLGVDAQYFSVILIPQRSSTDPIWYSLAQPLRVGPVDPEWKSLTNTSCRLITLPRTLQPGGNPLLHDYLVFAGPKRPPLLTRYGLQELVIYGWFWWVAVPMLWVLHFFHDYVVFNYGLAIIMLTVVVRGAMFPFSKKQAIAAQKMQKIQPELRIIAEKYKNDPQARLRAQQELFRKYNYNPLGGCLIVLIQLPIFIGLYKALLVDVELRQAPLISQSIRWCSDLSAPDMLWDWSGFWAAIGWHWFNEGYGMFALGPYFNLLPVLTVLLMIVQQKMFSPPPTDEQARVQQQVMTFMLIFMGLLFFKVASGLCIYFIASSLWGVLERKLVPALVHEDGQATAAKPPKKRPKWLEGFRRGWAWIEKMLRKLEQKASEQTPRDKSAAHPRSTDHRKRKKAKR